MRMNLHASNIDNDILMRLEEEEGSRSERGLRV